MDLGPIFSALCALGVVCAGSLGLLAFIGIRFFGRNLTGMLDQVTGGGSAEDYETPYERSVRRGGSRSPIQLRRPDEIPFGNVPDEPGRIGAPPRSIPRSPTPGRPIPRVSGTLGDVDRDMRSLRDRGRTSRRDGDYEIYDDDDSGGMF